MKTIERMKFVFVSAVEAADRLHIDWNYLESNGVPQLQGRVHSSKMWDPANYEPEMEIIVCYQPPQYTDGFGKLRTPAPRGLVRGRLIRTTPSYASAGWHWLHFTVQFQANEGPEQFAPKQMVQIQTDNTPQIDLAPQLREDEVLGTDLVRVSVQVDED